MQGVGILLAKYIASIGKSSRLIPNTPEEGDQLLDVLVKNGKFPHKFGDPKLPKNVLNKESMHHEEECIPNEHDGNIRGEELHSFEVEALNEKDQKVNANLDSFKSLMNFDMLKNYFGYISNSTEALQDARLFLLNRENHYLQDVFNSGETKSMKSLKSVAMESCEHKIKFFIPPNVFDQQLRIRRTLPVMIRGENPDIKVPLDEVFGPWLFTKNPVYLMVRMLLDTKCKSLEKKISKYIETQSKSGQPLTKQKAEAPPNAGLSSNPPVRISQLRELDPLGVLQDIPPETTQSALQDQAANVASSYTPSVWPGPERNFSVDWTTDKAGTKEECESWLSAEEKKYFDTIIIHIHGGGFIGTSTSMHQTYLTKWANKLKVPVFAMDYRLAPQVKFPFLVNDCIRMYIWILTFLTDVLGCNIKKVIFTGDSAGGNLILSLTNWCIEHGYRKPDHIQAHYPAACVTTKEFVPCLMYSMEDYLLYFGTLYGVVDMYVPPNVDQLTNYYLSPLKTPKEILKEYPPSEFFLCERDPLRDHALKMYLELL
jgi:acetyl esterase/lipase